MACITIESPVGPLFISVRGGRVRAIEFRRGTEADQANDLAARPDAAQRTSDEKVLDLCRSELSRYFEGNLKAFSVPVEMEGPAFHKKVWGVLASIPFGSTLTYAEIAARLGSPKAARAVGNACARNPVVVVVPCHRVLARNGLGGFGGGLPAKRWLLTHENHTLPPKY